MGRDHFRRLVPAACDPYDFSGRQYAITGSGRISRLREPAVSRETAGACLRAFAQDDAADAAALPEAASLGKRPTMSFKVRP